MSDEKLAVELLAHRDSVARLFDDVRESRVLAEKWRDSFCRLAASGSVSYENLLAKYRLPWENQSDSGA